MATSPSIIDSTPVVTSHIYTHDATQPAQVVKNWHDDVHTGPFWLCFEQPCHAVNKVLP